MLEYLYISVSLSNSNKLLTKCDNDEHVVALRIEKNIPNRYACKLMTSLLSEWSGSKMHSDAITLAGTCALRVRENFRRCIHFGGDVKKNPS